MPQWSRARHGPQLNFGALGGIELGELRIHDGQRKPQTHGRFLAWIYRRSERRVCFGLPVAQLWPDANDRLHSLPKVEAALALIREHDPRRFDRLLRDVAGIFLFGTTGDLAYWLSAPRLIVLREGFVRWSDTTVPLLAATLLHEACHAWLDQLGFDYRPERRHRIEAICARTEIAFAKRLPETDRQAIITRAEKLLAMPATAWSAQAFRDRRIAYLHALGLPRGLTAALAFITRRKGYP